MSSRREGHAIFHCIVLMLPNVANVQDVTVKSRDKCDAASADKIVAQPGTITGSIGVAFGKFNAAQALKDQGINVDTVAVGRNATAQSLFHNFTKEQRRQVNVLMDRCDTLTCHGSHVRLQLGQTVQVGCHWGEAQTHLHFVPALGMPVGSYKSSSVKLECSNHVTMATVFPT